MLMSSPSCDLRSISFPIGFAQKLSIVRSFSLDQHENSMWELIERINRLRNVLAHSLENSSRRVDAMNALRSTYRKERALEDWEKDDAPLILSAVAHCLGFLDAFEQEVERFKGWVKVMDVAINPHRYFPKEKLDPNSAKSLSEESNVAKPPAGSS